MKLKAGDKDLGMLAEAAREIGANASAAIREIYESDFAVENKADKSPLTAADMASHNLICRELQALTPDLPVLSEESAEISHELRRAWRRYWLVDPLDGTREFVQRNGEFTVNIALIDDHRPVLGVVGVPVQRLCYFAWRGSGAFRQNDGGAPERVQTRRTSPGRIVAIGSRSHGSKEQGRFFESLGAGAEIITIGSALKFCLVAQGGADIYPRFGPTSEWDTAAAQCVVEEAGGLVLDFDGQSMTYNTRDNLLNPHFIVIGDKAFDWAPFLRKLHS